jgi:hypothetical protein
LFSGHVLGKDEKIVWTVCEATEELELAEQAGGNRDPGSWGARNGAKKRKTSTPDCRRLKDSMSDRDRNSDVCSLNDCNLEVLNLAGETEPVSIELDDAL